MKGSYPHAEIELYPAYWDGKNIAFTAAER